LSDAQRYFSIAQSIFAPFFSLTPSSDPCIVKDYVIYQSISPLVPWPISDRRIELTGSMGSYVLKVDKTIATNTVSVYLRAVTRGLNTVDQ